MPVNPLGMVMLPIAVFCAVLMGAGDLHYSTLEATLLIGLPFFLLDAGYRVWRWSPDHDIILHIFEDTGGGQFGFLPLWVWPFVFFTAALAHSTLLGPFGMILCCTDLAYRYRRARLDNYPLWRSFLRLRGVLPPLWLLACGLIALAL